MSDKINKSSLKEAKASFEEIQKFAVEEATKNLKEDVSKKVIEIMNNSIDAKSLKEEVTINADGTIITIDDNGNVDVEAEGSIEDTGEEEVISTEEPIEMDSEEEIVVSDDEDEIEIDNSEIEEMNLEEMNFEEQDELAAAAAPEAAAMPAETPDEMPAEMPAEEVMANPFQAIMDKMDQMMGMLGGNAAASGSEEIDIIDDTDAAAAPAPAPAPAPAAAAPVAEEITFEVVNNEMEIPEMEMEDDVLEIVGEVDMDDEDTVDEMHGVGQNLRHSNRLGKLPRQGSEHRIEINENKAQYEAKLAELIKENESLKAEREELEQELIKFENGFIKLQENFGEMQDYNAKLVMAYKVAMSGGLTSDEKVQISEQFDKCETVEDAEKLYKSIVSEHKIKVNKNPEKSIKSNSIKTVPAKSVSQPLYESKEISRMKQLAGIKGKEI